jgi:hypothetical protein
MGNLIKGHQVARWSAASSFFATIGAIGAINILDPNDRLRFISAVFVGMVTGGAVYTRERLTESKTEQSKYGGDIVVTEDQGKKIFTLELEGNPEELEKHSEVLFKVVKPK